MKKIIITTAVCVAAGAVVLPAQNTQSGYFLDSYTYAYQMNPALGNDKNFVAMPAIGNLDVALRGNLHLTDILYNVDGKTTTFLNPGVSVSEVMGNLSDVNKIGSDIRINLLGAGFKAWGGYNTVRYRSPRQRRSAPAQERILTAEGRHIQPHLRHNRS